MIQQLKQQKHELQTERQAERRRAKTSENISAAVLSNLSSGVMFFTPDGLVRQANAAARRILGFASPVENGGTDVPGSCAGCRLWPGETNVAEMIQVSLRVEDTVPANGSAVCDACGRKADTRHHADRGARAGARCWARRA